MTWLLFPLLFAGQDDAVERILRRIDAQLQDSEQRLREDIGRILREQLRVDRSAEKKRAWLGFSPAEFTDAERARLHVDKGTGIKVLEVSRGGPSEKAGLRSGDIVLSIAGTAVGEENILPLLESIKPGVGVELLVIRGSDRIRLQVVPGEKKD